MCKIIKKCIKVNLSTHIVQVVLQVIDKGGQVWSESLNFVYVQ